MPKSAQSVLFTVALVVSYFISFRMYANKHFMMGNGGPGTISMPVWRVDNTPIDHALMTLFAPLRALPPFSAPVEWY